MINNFDLTLLSALNQFAHMWQNFDRFVVLIQYNNLFKGGVILPFVYYVWFKADLNSVKRRYLIAMLLSTLPAELMARLMAKTLPFRFRPIHDININFFPPFNMDLNILEGHSSFPSDHAVLFFCLSTGLLFCSKRLGTFALLYTLIFIALPRIYLGLHYPTDIMAGAAIGIIFLPLLRAFTLHNAN